MSRFRDWGTAAIVQPSRFWLVLLSGLVFGSCAGVEKPATIAPTLEVPAAPAPAAPSLAASDAVPPGASSTATPDLAQWSPTGPRPSRPQLIRRASLQLRVDQVEASLKKVAQLIQAQQGTLLGLQDQTPTEAARRHRISLQLQVPQERLEITLEALTQLGTIQGRSLTAEDVSEQLVDYQARLRNLRQAEAVVLKILERTGSIKEVLEVSRELSHLRAAIEQIDAQLSSLQHRVAYSEIALTLEAAIATPPPHPPFGQQIQETWTQATGSVVNFTTGLAQLSLWLFAYSPYLLVLGIVLTLGYRQICKKFLPLALPAATPPPANPDIG